MSAAPGFFSPKLLKPSGPVHGGKVLRSYLIEVHADQRIVIERYARAGVISDDAIGGGSDN